MQTHLNETITFEVQLPMFNKDNQYIYVCIVWEY